MTGPESNGSDPVLRPTGAAGRRHGRSQNSECFTDLQQVVEQLEGIVRVTEDATRSIQRLMGQLSRQAKVHQRVDASPRDRAVLLRGRASAPT